MVDLGLRAHVTTAVGSRQSGIRRPVSSHRRQRSFAGCPRSASIASVGSFGKPARAPSVRVNVSSVSVPRKASNPRPVASGSDRHSRGWSAPGRWIRPPCPRDKADAGKHGGSRGRRQVRCGTIQKHAARMRLHTVSARPTSSCPARAGRPDPRVPRFTARDTSRTLRVLSAATDRTSVPSANRGGQSGRLAAHDQADQILGSVSANGAHPHHPAVTQHGPPVGDLEYLVKAVADIRSCRRLSPSEGAAPEQPLHLMRGRLAMWVHPAPENQQSTASARAMATKDFSVRVRFATRVVGSKSAQHAPRPPRTRLGSRASRSAPCGAHSPRRARCFRPRSSTRSTPDPDG